MWLKPALLWSGVVLSGLCLLTFSGTAQQPPAISPANVKPNQPKTPDVKPIDIPGVHNAFRLGKKVISGSSPHDEASFKALAALGVKTIITVDGARPDVESAKKYGIRYVQLPIGYDGITREKATEIARAVRDLPGSIFMHCHHGLHRGPAAAACAMIATDKWSNDDAIAWMQKAGTGKNYTGLWEAARLFDKPTKEEFDKAPAEFPSTAKTSSLVQVMVRMDELAEHLQESRAAKWTTPVHHPDLDPPHEALMLREVITELLRDEDTNQRPADYVAWLKQSEADSLALEMALRAKDTVKADESFNKIMATCSSCHAVYRNVPRK